MNAVVERAALPGRDAFDIPTGVSYLNAAAYGPLSRATLAAASHALSSRAAPWSFDKAAAAADIERARALAGSLIGADARDLALVTSVSHAAAIAASTLLAVRGARVVRLAGEHPSNVLPWVAMAARGCVEEIVTEPANGDWTSAVLEAIERPGAAPLAVAAFGPYHWSDGARLDLDRVIPAVRKQGGAVFIDATHAVGVDPIDVRRHRPEFLAFPLFKWLMGPYGMAFLYADPRCQQGEPSDRSATNSVLTAELAWGGFAPGARRYDRGERDDPVSAALAAAALSQAVSWNTPEMASRVRSIGNALAAAAEQVGAGLRPEKFRAPHVLGLRFNTPGVRAGELVKSLAAQGVMVSERRGVVRVAAHLYNDAADVERFAMALRVALRT